MKTLDPVKWMASGLGQLPELKTEVRLFDACATLTDEQLAAGNRDELAPVKPAPATAVKTPASAFKLPAETVAGRYVISRTVRAL